MSNIKDASHEGNRDPGPTWRVENVVCTTAMNLENAGGTIDLSLVSRETPEAQYNPSRFPGLIFRSVEPRATVLLFSTGKMVITGLRTGADAVMVVSAVRSMLERLKIKVTGDPEVRVQNIVSSGSLGVSINLDEASMTLDNVVYEPEVFPGMIYRMIEPKVVILLFSTGKFVVTGAKNEEIIKEAVTKLVNVIETNGLKH